jgi:hypothetical protein
MFSKNLSPEITCCNKSGPQLNASTNTFQYCGSVGCYMETGSDNRSGCVAYEGGNTER